MQMSPKAGNGVPQEVRAGVLVRRKDLTAPHAAVSPRGAGPLAPGSRLWALLAEA